MAAEAGMGGARGNERVRNLAARGELPFLTAHHAAVTPPAAAAVAPAELELSAIN